MRFFYGVTVRAHFMSAVVAALIFPGLAGCTAAAEAACQGANIASAALAPNGGLQPAAVTQSLGPTTAFFAALADMAYVTDLGLTSPRKSIWPCLQSWGAQGSSHVILNSTDAAGGVSHATLFRTNRDIFLLFRGLDDGANAPIISDDLTPEPAAAYFGVPATAAGAARSVWVLRGFLRAHKAIEPLYQAEIDRLVAELPQAHRSSYHIWIVGHSDGSSLAQLAAPRIVRNANYGRARLGGVFLFGPQRVGSTAFARLYNSRAGQRTVRFQYGWDPAWEELYLPNATATSNSGTSSSSSSVTGTLAAAGRGFTVCPSRTAARERLVLTPLGSDQLNACGDPANYLQGTPAAAAAAGVAEDGGAMVTSFSGAEEEQQVQQQQQQQRQQVRILRKPGATSSSSSTSISTDVTSLDFLAHHLPSVYFDGLIRVLGPRIDNCTRTALQLPQCIVSTKCSAALRPDPLLSGKCATCGSNATCRVAWKGAAGGVCDSTSSKSSGFLCYKQGAAPPGLYGGLLGLFG